MNTGTYISGSAHGALILWALVGGYFLSPDEPSPADISDVSIISSAEFAAMTLPDTAPDVPSAEPVVQSPVSEDVAPDVASETDDKPAAPAVTEVAPPDSEALPDTPDALQTPPVEVPDDAPILDQPPSAVTDVPVENVTDEAPKAAEAPRIAPMAAPEAPPGAEIADTTTPEVVPDQEAEQTAEEAPATAPEEATTEIVTEAETPARSAMASSKRPVSRPPPPAPRPEPAEATQEQAINDALAGLEDQTPAPAANIPTGPPMTGAEKDGFRIAVRQCWVVDVGSQAANVTVTVAFSLDPEGRVIQGSLKMLGSDGGEGNAVTAAFDAARRAILRCQKGGYDLPRDKYGQWQNVEMTFNPKSMRIK